MTHELARFENEAVRLGRLYETTTFARVHANVQPFLPQIGARVLDVGSGSGRDAAELARRGYLVTAVEPASAFLAASKARHGELGIIWIRDSLPTLESLEAMQFDFILLSAVWMYVLEEDRSAAAARLWQLTRVGGTVALSMRPLEFSDLRVFSEADIRQTPALFEEVGFSTISRSTQSDTLGRDGKLWTGFVFARRG